MPQALPEQAEVRAPPGRASILPAVAPPRRRAPNGPQAAASVLTRRPSPAPRRLQDLTLPTAPPAALGSFFGGLDLSAAPPHRRRIALGGHRGLGMNRCGAGAPPAPFRENTVSSFLAAVAAGATFLEFDVQVTADGVPVVFHDDFLLHGHHDALSSWLVADLTVAAFKSLAPIHAAPSDSDGGPAGASDDDDGGASTATWAGSEGEGAGSLSFLGGGGGGGGGGGASPFGGSPAGGSPAGGSHRGAPRLLRRHHHDMPAAPAGPSVGAWAAQQEDHLPTLAEVFAAVPAHVAFNIEVKMATGDHIARTPDAEVRRVVDATLAAVAAEAAGSIARRHVAFSSFDPEVCCALRAAAPAAAPVLFLSGGGAYAHADARRTSVDAALRFAAGAGLAGVVLEAGVLREGPGAVAAAAAAGLRVMSYGAANDDPSWVRQQAALGVAAVIVDDVAGVARALARR
jgi:glycerophosphodiester phosphodiesterase